MWFDKFLHPNLAHSIESDDDDRLSSFGVSNTAVKTVAMWIEDCLGATSVVTLNNLPNLEQTESVDHYAHSLQMNEV
jgi:hypothetical protein